MAGRDFYEGDFLQRIFRLPFQLIRMKMFARPAAGREGDFHESDY